LDPEKGCFCPILCLYRAGLPICHSPDLYAPARAPSEAAVDAQLRQRSAHSATSQAGKELEMSHADLMPFRRPEGPNATEKVGTRAAEHASMPTRPWMLGSTQAMDRLKGSSAWIWVLGARQGREGREGREGRGILSRT
jgi:hypothetical protein